jgi:hypothetical protein
MDEISYINESYMADFIVEECERARGLGKDFIHGFEGFAGHLIGVGNRAEEVAHMVRERNENLKEVVNPGVVKVAGYMHDIGKIKYGDPFHEIYGAVQILEEGEKIGLVCGGTSEEKKKLLNSIAACLPSDGPLAEELRGFPSDFSHRYYHTQELEDKINYLRKELSENEPLSVTRLTSPDTLEKAICLYSDWSDLGGKKISVEERIGEIDERYRKIASGKKVPEREYYLKVNEYVQQSASRIIGICGIVEGLAGIK